MVLDDLFKDVPNHGILLLDQFLRLLDGGAMAALFEPVIDEGLEELEGHFLGQTALVKLQFGADHDDGTAGVIDALAEQVLAEAALLAFVADIDMTIGYACWDKQYAHASINLGFTIPTGNDWVADSFRSSCWQWYSLWFWYWWRRMGTSSWKP